jgi:hypothetical protein
MSKYPFQLDTYSIFKASYQHLSQVGEQHQKGAGQHRFDPAYRRQDSYSHQSQSCFFHYLWLKPNKLVNQPA